LSMLCHLRHQVQHADSDCCGDQAIITSCPMMMGNSGCSSVAPCCASPSEPRIASEASGAKKEPVQHLMPIAAHPGVSATALQRRRIISLTLEPRHIPAVFDLKTDMRV
jgi:hypothetical protein